MKKKLSQLNKDLDLRRFGKNEYTKAASSGNKDFSNITILEWVNTVCPPEEEEEGGIQPKYVAGPDAILDLNAGTVVSDTKLKEFLYPDSTTNYMAAYLTARVGSVPGNISFPSDGGGSIGFIATTKQNKQTVTIDGVQYNYYIDNPIV